MKVNFNKMCDKCLRMVGDSEQLVGFKAVDDLGNVRVFRGHPQCIEDIGQTLIQLYGERDEGNDGQ